MQALPQTHCKKPYAVIKRRGEFIVVYDSDGSRPGVRHRAYTAIGAQDWALEQERKHRQAWRFFQEALVGLAIAGMVISFLLILE